MLTTRRTFLQTAAAISAAQHPGLRALAELVGPVAASAPEIDAFAGASLGHELLKPELVHSLSVRCLAKQVYAERMIDDMESEIGWAASPAVNLSYTSDHSKSGKRSMRFHAVAYDHEYVKSARTTDGHFTGADLGFAGIPYSAFLTLNFKEPQDWSAYNRLSLWCYLHPTQLPTTSVSLQFVCQGASAGPSDPISIHYVADLKPGEWNHLTWEISEYQRDKIVQFILFKPTSGLPLRDFNNDITMDFDQFTLQRVHVEPVSGWQVSKGKIAFSHIGYRSGAVKLAFAGSGAETFRIVESGTGAVRRELPARILENRRGRYSVLDFTEFTQAGAFYLEYGETKTDPFPIREDVYETLIDSTLNTFQGFRCGCAVPGAHDACHLDTFAEYKGERRSMAGGWHDAANLTQFSDSTQLSVLTLLRLYEVLVGDPAQRARAARTLEEAKWGLDWSLRMRFAPGVRLRKNNTEFWTDTKVGTDDDVVENNVGFDLRETVFALPALSTAGRVLQPLDARLAERARQAAEEDYAAIRPSLNKPLIPVSYGDAGRGSWRDLCAYITLSAVELYRATGKSMYREDAVRFGGWLVDLQEQSFVQESPVTGYFYANAERTQIQRESYGSCDDAGPLALQALCETLVDDKEWMRWYVALFIYSEYFSREGSTASAPFHVLPASVWRKRDLETDMRPDMFGERLATHPMPLFPTPPTEAVTRKQMAEMYEAATPLAPEMRLRIMPLWYNHAQHGGTTAHLCRTAALACAAQTRNNFELAELALRQLEWVTGANPFSRSLLYGVGYDYWQNFTCNNINFVGGLGLGMNSYADDAPAWPNNAVFPYKEQWSYSNSRMAINMAQSAVNARIRGQVGETVELREQRTGERITVPAGAFDRSLPPGRYSATAGGFTWKLNLLGGKTYSLTLDPHRAIQITLSVVPSPGLSLTAEVRGTGKHSIELRTFNCKAAKASRALDLSAAHAATLHWELNVEDRSKPWLVLVVPEGAPEFRQEAFGRIGQYPVLS